VKPFSLLFISIVLTVPTYAQTPQYCADRKFPPKAVGSYRLKISEIRTQDTDAEENRCVASVVTELGSQLVIARDWDLAWLPAVGKDVNGDGLPDAIVEGYSGGAHCCWTYWFVSLGQPPEVYLKLENERDIAIDTSTPGHTYIRTQDGAFDYFDGLCHACTSFPTVILELQGEVLSDAGWSFVAEYDRDIAKARHEFEYEDDGEEFAALSKYVPGLGAKYNRAKAAALTVVLAYLYSGREDQAWQALDAMWPVNDRARIKDLILNTRAQGILSQTSTPPPSLQPQPVSASPE